MEGLVTQVSNSCMPMSILSIVPVYRFRQRWLSTLLNIAKAIDQLAGSNVILCHVYQNKTD